MLPIFHFWISSENISTTKTKLPLNSIYNSGFWWILDFGELPPGNEKGSVITIMQFDVRNVLNVLNHIFYDSTTLYEFYACHEKRPKIGQFIQRHGHGNPKMAQLSRKLCILLLGYFDVGRTSQQDFSPADLKKSKAFLRNEKNLIFLANSLWELKFSTCGSAGYVRFEEYCM